MTKIHILIPCKQCNGAAYLLVGEATSYIGNVYTQYSPCPHCQGSGNQEAWISLEEFKDLLKEQEDIDLVSQQ